MSLLSFTYHHTEAEMAGQTCYVTQSQHANTGPTRPSIDPVSPGDQQGSLAECQFSSHWYDSTRKTAGLDSRVSRSTASPLTTAPLEAVRREREGS